MTEQTNIKVQYLTFQTDEEIYALDISQVREVLDFTPIIWTGFMKPPVKTWRRL